MKSLETLLKVAQRRMDEYGVEATRIGQVIEQLRMQEATILAKEETEIQLAAREPSFAQMLPAYRARVKVQVNAVRAQIAEKEAILAEVRQRLNAAYQEKSKFEQLIEQDALRRTAERAARDQAALDEVAINRVGMAGK
jgi:flagellar export protein FliJ